MSEVKSKVLDPDSIMLKFEATFSLGEWKMISEAMNESYRYPMSDLAEAIRDCTH